MKLKRFKERDNKRIGIILFTIVCILLVSGVILYRTFAIFEVKINQNIINGDVQGMGDIEFAFYKEVDGKDTIVKEVPKKDEGYSLDTSSSYCIDLLNNQQVSNVNWNDEKWSLELKNVSTTKTKCYLHFKKIYKEEILNGAIPDLMNGRLVPVQIKDEQPTEITVQNMNGSYGGKVVKADITSNWYSYKHKEWANAVILRDGKADDYEPGQEILESDIESYFVWIPRYRYTLQEDESTYTGYTNVITKGNYSDVKSFYEEIGGNKGESNDFEIEFGSKDKAISSTSLSKGTFIVHPAFEAFNSNGFWVGKFETGYNQNEDGTVMPTNSWNKAGAEVNEEKSTKVIIKPNVYSWRSINVSNAFYTSYHYQRDLESHMMKNMEWGAVAYLTQSKYGRCSENGNCDEVRINNSESYITGMSAKEAPTCGYTGTKENCNWYETTDLTKDGTKVLNYYNKASQVASTTGNYSGIYDMSGGSWEYVMGVLQSSKDDATPASGRNQSYNSGFKGPYSCPNCDNQNAEENTNGLPWPSSKYYDLYDYDTIDQNYYRGKLGDGTKEFGPFYRVAFQKPSGGNGPTRRVGSYNGDDAFFINGEDPWFRRGSIFTDGTDAGLGAFYDYGGHAQAQHSFRIVLTP